MLNMERSQKWYSFFLHIHPKKIEEQALKFSLTFGLGGIATLLFSILVFTGIILKFLYTPTPDLAYESITYIRQNLVFGNIIRNLHHWSANVLIVVASLHMLRILLTGAYFGKRRSNWYIGISLLILTILMNFTGYLLPWDQLSFWAITVSSNMLDYIPFIGSPVKASLLQGELINSSTLLFFYNLHTGIIPLSVILLLLLHYWGIRKNGGVVISENSEQKKLAVNPHLIKRELAVGLILFAVLLILSYFFNAPLEDKADITDTPIDIKAPWYFMGFQELLIHFHPIIAIVILPGMLLFLAIRLPKIKGNIPIKGVWFQTSNGRKTAVITVIVGCLVGLAFIFIDDRFLSQSNLFTSGILSLIILSIIPFILKYLLSLKYKLSKSEIVQIFILYILTIFLIFTLTGIFLRDAGMVLIF